MPRFLCASTRARCFAVAVGFGLIFGREPPLPEAALLCFGFAAGFGFVAGFLGFGLAAVFDVAGFDVAALPLALPFGLL